jgi:predicted DNA-binding helix-hairpin-helix protein
MDTEEKLRALAEDGQYDLACACGTNADDRRRRAPQGDRWVYPVTLPNGGRSLLFKTLMSNECANDCRYCPLRANSDTPRRCSLSAEEVVRVFLDYWRARKVFGLFLSGAVRGTADRSMERINQVARRLRYHEGFRGYIHLKILPGASDEAIREAVSLASAVSLNIETAGEKHFRRLSEKKDYLRDVIRPMRLIHALTSKGMPHSRVKQTTQFVVGASDETDRELVRYVGGLYQRLDLSRVYFSAYQRGAGDPSLPGENRAVRGQDLLLREHRLYQTDWLIRRYGFQAEEIPFDADGALRADMDPKEHWARLHPERFPVDINRASRFELLRVPGLGPESVKKILALRRSGGRLRAVSDLGRSRRYLERASRYVTF